MEIAKTWVCQGCFCFSRLYYILSMPSVKHKQRSSYFFHNNISISTAPNSKKKKWSITENYFFDDLDSSTNAKFSKLATRTCTIYNIFPSLSLSYLKFYMFSSSMWYRPMIMSEVILITPCATTDVSVVWSAIFFVHGPNISTSASCVAGASCFFSTFKPILHIGCPSSG